MTRSLTFWIDCFTTLPNRAAAIAAVKDLTAQVSAAQHAEWSPSVLLPTNYGPWPQSECSQTLPADLLVSSPDDVAAIRADFEANGIGFGHWFVPLNCTEYGPDDPRWQYDDPLAPGVQIPELCAAFAAASGYSAANFEPGPQFWKPGNNPFAINSFWGRFWNALPDQSVLANNTCVTLVPNTWGVSAFGGTVGPMAGGGPSMYAGQSLVNLAGGVTSIALECYGGPNTSASYPYPGLWPHESFDYIHTIGEIDWGPTGTRIIPILAIENLLAQIKVANHLGAGEVQVWAL